MSRLIDADKLIEICRKGWKLFGREDEKLKHWVDEYDIRNQPTVDAVEVIRCKNCKHFDRNEIGRAEGGMYNICSEGRGMFLSGDDFCSSAERREE